MNDFGDIIEPIFEVSPYRSDILKKIDYNFSQIKKNSKDLTIRKELSENIKNFTNIDNIVITIKPKFMNAAVIPVYNRLFSTRIFSSLKKYETTEDLTALQTVEESSKYIRKIYILLGQDLIDEFSSRQLTAILLHEFGHCFTHTSNTPFILLKILSVTSDLISHKILLSIPITSLTTSISLPIQLSLLVSIILFSKSLTFFEHKGEYKADQFAIKYGYGDEMIKVLNFYHKSDTKSVIGKSWYSKLGNFISGILTVSTHPASSSRIKSIHDQLTKDYKKMYPEISTELNIILTQNNILK
jgi:hypothetical protein